MSASSLGGATALRPFKLRDIPEQVRQRAADAILTSADCPDGLAERLALGVAAARPSERVYWVSAAAWERESRKRTWRAAP